QRDALAWCAPRRLAAAASRRCPVLPVELCDLADKPHCEVVLALNVLHHLLKSEEGCGRLAAFLGRLRAGALFLEAHDPAEPQMHGAYWNPGPECFAAWVAERARLPRVARIGAGEEPGRLIFRLGRA